MISQWIFMKDGVIHIHMHSPRGWIGPEDQVTDGYAIKM